METVAAKIPPEMEERIEEYREERGLNRSQAIRELVDEGFESIESGIELTFPMMLIWFGSLMVVSASIEFEVLVADRLSLGLVLMLLGFALSSPSFDVYLDRLRDVYDDRLRRDRGDAA